MTKNYRSSGSFGKRQEFVAIAELLKRHFDLYMTLVDDQQIDCVIRQRKEDELRYLDIQIKARSNKCQVWDGGLFSAMEIAWPRSNFYFIFYSEHLNLHWVICSLDLVRLASRNKKGKNAGLYSLNFCNCPKAGLKPREKFREYENAFHLLEWN